MEQIEFIDLKKQQQRIRQDLDRRIAAVLSHGQYIMGPEIQELEDKLAAYTGSRHCITAASGTDALLVALMSLGVQAGDEVITTPFTFIATGETISLLGAVPVFVDIDPRSYNIDPCKIDEVITEQTRAIIPVSLYGNCADFDAIDAVVSRHNQKRLQNGKKQIHVIEDACQSFGATYKGRKSCALSTIGCTSFFPSKPLGCYGDAGACFTDNEDLALSMRQIRVHGQERRYHHTRLGVNARMDTLQAAVVLAKLELFPEEVALRAKIGARYSELINDAVGAAAITPYIESNSTSVYAQFTVQVEEREKVIRLLGAPEQRVSRRGAKVPTAVHYPVPLHLQPMFKGLQLTSGSFPVAERAASRVLSLPMHPYLTEPEMELIAESLAEALC